MGNIKVLLVAGTFEVNKMFKKQFLIRIMILKSLQRQIMPTLRGTKS